MLSGKELSRRPGCETVTFTVEAPAGVRYIPEASLDHVVLEIAVLMTAVVPYERGTYTLNKWTSFFRHGEFLRDSIFVRYERLVGWDMHARFGMYRSK